MGRRGRLHTWGSHDQPHQPHAHDDIDDGAENGPPGRHGGVADRRMYCVNRASGTNDWIIALMESPSTKARPDVQKKPTAVFAASPYHAKK
jgi:hypothetical protein